jgi:hypothetical protein
MVPGFSSQKQSEHGVNFNTAYSTKTDKIANKSIFTNESTGAKMSAHHLTRLIIGAIEPTAFTFSRHRENPIKTCRLKD